MSLRLSRGGIAIGVGTVIALGGLVLSSVLGARILTPERYTAYAAVLSILGVLAQGPANAVEQDAARRLGHAGRLGRVPLGPPVRTALLTTAIAALVALAPVAGWQQRLFGPDWALPAVAVAVGVPLLVAAALARGAAAGLQRRGLLGAMYAATGLGVVGLPLALLGAGLPAFTAFAVGGVIGQSLPAVLGALALPVLRRVRLAPVPDDRPTGRIGTLVMANLLLSANMASIPAVLRLHVGAVPAATLAAAQIAVSASRLSTLLVNSLQPVVIGRIVRLAGAARRRFAAWWVGGAAVSGVVTVVGMVVVGPWLLTLVYGDAYSFTPVLLLGSSLAVLFLNPAYVLMALATARGRYGAVAVAWGLGAVVLAATAMLDPGAGLGVVLAGITLAAALPVLVLLVPVRSRRGTPDPTSPADPASPADATSPAPPA